MGGLECFSGIPGSVGGTVIQNVGAYGSEVSNVIKKVKLFNRQIKKIYWINNCELKFDYRTSSIKNKTEIVVLEVQFVLNTKKKLKEGWSAPIYHSELAFLLDLNLGERSSPMLVRRAVIQLRINKGMVINFKDYDTWSVGSFFINPIISCNMFLNIQNSYLISANQLNVPHFFIKNKVKLSAGWLIEHAGFTKGYPGCNSPARLSTKHTLALTNRGKASSFDIISLAKRIRNKVYECFGITLEPEASLIGCKL